MTFSIEFARDSPVFSYFGGLPFIYENHQWVFALGSLLTIVIELGAALIFFTRSHKVRAVIMVLLFCMHLSLYLLGIPGFVWIWTVSFVYFIPPELFSDCFVDSG